MRSDDSSKVEKTTKVVSGYGVPKNKPEKRIPEKPNDLPKEVEQWLESAQQSRKP